MSKKGNFSLKGDPGDLLIKVSVRPHPSLKREGADIISEKKVTLSQAALGTTLKVDTIWGSQDVRVRPGVVHDEKIVLQGQGVNMLPPN